MKFKYRVLHPKARHADTPAIILLHGIGGNIDTLNDLASRLIGQFLVIQVEGTHRLSEGRYAWYHIDFEQRPPKTDFEQAEESRLALVSFIDEVTVVHQVKPGNVFLAGFSQGGIISFDIAFSCPEKIRGLISMSGRVVPKPGLAIAEPGRLSHLSALLIHGSADEIIPPSLAERALDISQGYGIDSELVIYDFRHDVNEEEINHIVEWLLIKTNNTVPIHG